MLSDIKCTWKRTHNKQTLTFTFWMNTKTKDTRGSILTQKVVQDRCELIHVLQTTAALLVSLPRSKHNGTFEVLTLRLWTTWSSDTWRRVIWYEFTDVSVVNSYLITMSHIQRRHQNLKIRIPYPKFQWHIQCDQKSLCTWWLQYRKLQVMFKVSPASLQTFIDTPGGTLDSH
jgi:hypothetical protein